MFNKKENKLAAKQESAENKPIKQEINQSQFFFTVGPIGRQLFSSEIIEKQSNEPQIIILPAKL